MPTIMGQNAVRPDELSNSCSLGSIDGLNSSSPRASLDSHHAVRGRILKESSHYNSFKPLSSDMVAQQNADLTSSLSSKPTQYHHHHPHTKVLSHKTSLPALQTLSLPLEKTNSMPTPISPPTSSPSYITPPSSASSTGSSTTNSSSPMSHLRRWTSSLSTSSKKSQQNHQHQDASPASSKPNSKGSNPTTNTTTSTTKVRTIVIGSPQPLTTPVPYACTPLPYSDSPTISPSNPHSSLHFDQIPRCAPVSKPPATSCPDLPIGSHQNTSSSSDSSTASATSPVSAGSSQSNHRASWKNRLFTSSNKKQEDNRRASTHSITEDDYEWSSAEPQPESAATKMRTRQPSAPQTFQVNQQPVQVISAPLMSPTDDIFGPDTFDPFNVTSHSRSDGSAIEEAVYKANNDTPRSIFDTLDIAAAGTLKDSDLGSQVESTIPHTIEASEPTETKNENKGGVLDFAASLCKGLGSDFVMPPSYFDQHNLSLDFNESYPRDLTPANQTTEYKSPRPKVDPPSVHSASSASASPSASTLSSASTSSTSSSSSSSSQPSRLQLSARDRASRRASTCSVDSDDSESSTDSTDSSDSSQSSPISGASFFSTTPSVPANLSSTLSGTLLRTGSIKIPSSLMTLLPGGGAAGKERAAHHFSPPVTPPTTPPLDQTESMSSAMASSFNKNGNASPMASQIADPRAMTIKRFAYIHTLRKLKERERRPFRHAVLLHLILLQLRRGVTNKQCIEIGEFYVAMSAAQFPSRLDIAHAMVMAQQQQQQQQQQETSQESGTESDMPTVPARSTSKMNSPATAATGKELKTRKSLVFSIQSRMQLNKALQSSNNNSSNNPATGSQQQQQFTTLKDRLPLLRIPAYPLINLERKNGSQSWKSSSSSTSSDDGDDNEEDKSSNNNSNDESDLVNEPIRPTPTVILPKRTTGRKGILHQQQLQQLQLLQLQQQQLQMYQQGPDQARSNLLTEEQQANLSAMMSGTDPDVNGQGWPAHHPLLMGSRPSFANSTFTTVVSSGSELITKPLVSNSTTPTPSLPSSTASATSTLPALPATLFTGPLSQPSRRTTATSSVNTARSLIPSPDGTRYTHQGQYFDPSNTSVSSGPANYRSVKMMHSTLPPSLPLSSSSSPSSQSGGGMPAGLLTPPLSPLFRSDSVSGPVVSTQTTTATTTTMTPSGPSVSMARIYQPFPSSHVRVLSHPPAQQYPYVAVGSVPGPAPVPFVAPMGYGPVSNRMDSYRQQQQQQQQQQQMHPVVTSPRSSMEGRRTRTPSSSSTISSSSKAGLPSPPQSPTLASDGFMNNVIHSSANTIVSTPISTTTPSLQSTKMTAVAGIKAGRAPVLTRHSMDDLRRTPSSKIKTKSKLNNNSNQKEEEEDVPLAVVQKRLSSDLLRSMYWDDSNTYLVHNIT
ncbi:hypothetical protein BGZ83_010777 [Gryganskiella cystojenkinii]|nr:hypothetical protein BGZ83_010777 [Gryganskiella cystojenkinii]